MSRETRLFAQWRTRLPLRDNTYYSTAPLQGTLSTKSTGSIVSTQSYLVPFVRRPVYLSFSLELSNILSVNVNVPLLRWMCDVEIPHPSSCHYLSMSTRLLCVEHFSSYNSSNIPFDLLLDLHPCRISLCFSRTTDRIIDSLWHKGVLRRRDSVTFG